VSIHGTRKPKRRVSFRTNNTRHDAQPTVRPMCEFTNDGAKCESARSIRGRLRNRCRSQSAASLHKRLAMYVFVWNLPKFKDAQHAQALYHPSLMTIGPLPTKDTTGFCPALQPSLDNELNRRPAPLFWSLVSAGSEEAQMMLPLFVEELPYSVPHLTLMLLQLVAMSNRTMGDTLALNHILRRTSTTRARPSACRATPPTFLVLLKQNCPRNDWRLNIL
jgi:hypothetical protein